MSNEIACRTCYSHEKLDRCILVLKFFPNAILQTRCRSPVNPQSEDVPFNIDRDKDESLKSF